MKKGKKKQKQKPVLSWRALALFVGVLLVVGTPATYLALMGAGVAAEAVSAARCSGAGADVEDGQEIDGLGWLWFTKMEGSEHEKI
jgi:hypothetical protein